LLAQKAIDEQWLPQYYLVKLCEQEAGERYQKKLQRYLREVQLPLAKHLSQFFYRHQRHSKESNNSTDSTAAMG
jgi:DNA replication protein DnaC